MIKLKLKTIIQIYNEQGLNGVKRKIAAKFYMKEYLYKADIMDYNYCDHKFSLVDLNLGILDKMYKEYSRELDVFKYNILKDRLSMPSQKTFIVYENEDICGYFSISYIDVKESCANVTIKVPVESMYLFDDYTFEKHRGKGVHKFSILGRLIQGKNSGCKTAYVAIFAGNLSSEKAYERFSFRKIKKYSCFRFGKIKKTFEKVL